MVLAIEHRLEFQYSDFISESWVELRIEPRSSSRQTVNSFVLAVGPCTRVFRYEDHMGNIIRHFSIAEYHREIAVVAETVVQTFANTVCLDQVTEPIRPPVGATQDFLSFSGPITDSASLRHLFESIPLDANMTLGDTVRSIGETVHQEIEYRPNVTTYESTIDEALAHRAGVCQDKAQIMIGLLRLAGIPARYVSGYMFVSADISDNSESHAWIEFFSHEHGWVGYDPTGGIQPGEKHVIVATARHYDEVPPNRGVFRGSASEEMSASVRIREVEPPSFNGYWEEIQEIPVPVYAEFPGRRDYGAVEEQVEPTSNQQQQQQ